MVLSTSSRVVLADLLETVGSLPQPDVVVANLPYVPTDTVASRFGSLGWEPAAALDGGEDGLDVVRALLARLPDRLAADGSVLLEIGEGQAEPIRSAVLALPGRWTMTAQRDLAGLERIVRLERTAVTDRLPATPEGLAQAAELIRGGELVAFPTDTVHGVACRANDPDALERLFVLKRRPPDRQIAWLVTGIEQATDLGLAVDERARSLAVAFWPGGLTLVLGAPAAATGTLGVRAPDHQVAQGLLAATGPLPVTSANPHGFPECYTTDDVLVAFAESRGRSRRGGRG